MKSPIYFKKNTISFLLIITTITNVLGQETTIRGIVKDDFKNPLENVSVKIENGDTEVFTDATGLYNITVPAKSKLVFSYDGYKPKKVSTKNKDVINVFLKYNKKANDDKEVNTGYGKIKQSESTISASSVDEKFIEQENNLDMATYLRTVPGVRVIEEGGELNILIRGNRSLNSSDAPLIMLNGSQYNGSLKNLNPRDIKAIDVLKDASGTAAYGSRGANGVILISTK
ncbi:TonB-dependent receptor plug domain-containing protein [Flavobacteriaceae bacterium XHP0103]|uniref:TonB-dependent receptor plug domain-containing protein n=1 Tax=Marixanthotalea marina TaxID=2844359 RepID=UPI002989CF9C|nr:TonB-dependent receptor plug domain-containing protein [Marixanthotalea marina]MBU3822438.1 TonB-dependent receptor plug domain-containing protein [Marixanthotalea marina]